MTKIKNQIFCSDEKKEEVFKLLDLPLEILEKYNVVQPDKPPAKGVYPSQTGFGWTNAVFERFCQEFIDDNK